MQVHGCGGSEPELPRQMSGSLIHRDSLDWMELDSGSLFQEDHSFYKESEEEGGDSVLFTSPFISLKHMT